MNHSGFTLSELVITLAISCSLLLFAFPAFNEQIQRGRTLAATQELVEAIALARMTAVAKNSRAVLLNNGSWHEGWTLFLDSNNDGALSPGEVIVRMGGANKNVVITATSPMNSYISFIGSGESRQRGTTNTGALLMGNIKICPKESGAGYNLILSGGGRLRKEPFNDCDNVR